MFAAKDLQQLEEHGIREAEARRQLELLKKPPRPAVLIRACGIGDGIRRLDAAEQARYEAQGADMLARERSAKFTPASGAATRMFKDLLAALDQPEDMPPKAAAELMTHAERFAFYGAWKGALKAGTDKDFAMGLARGEWRAALAALLFHPGLEYTRLPKAFLDFHWAEGRAHTPMEEHWREAAALGLKRLHLTLSPEHEERFHRIAQDLRQRLPAEGLPQVEVDHSTQHKETDTLAGDGQGGLFRDAEDRLMLRPGGHGSLLRNLNAMGHKSDVVLIKNIDNITHPRLWPDQLRWKRIAAGVLDEAVKQGHDGPVRVAGIVRNTGEPGGGPFYVEGHEHPQIIETAQMDMQDPAQKAIADSAAFFSPTDLVCRLTDKHGKPYDLEKYVDPSAAFVTLKSHLGKPLLALERPGLWNGSMAGWKTVFLEIPLETFNPVKTVADLLRAPHQPEGD